MLRDSATLTLSNTVTPAEVWPARDSWAQDEYPPSDGGDIPPRQLISTSRTAVEDMLPKDDDDFKDPCSSTPRLSNLSLVCGGCLCDPRSTPKPVGRRVPKLCLGLRKGGSSAEGM